jgi:hypothetical protein
MFGTRDLGHNGKKKKKIITISINHHICAIFHAENNLSKLQFNFAHFIGPVLALHEPTSLHEKNLKMVWKLIDVLKEGNSSKTDVSENPINLKTWL